MQTAQSQNQSGWTRLSGRILEGGYELQDLLEADNLRALFKVRVLGDRELDCVATFFQLPEPESSRQIEIWESVRALRDPNLSAPLGAGKTEIGGSTATYVVTRRPDESLGGVLGERALAPSEAVDAFLTVSRALENLHLNGFAHGSLAPEQVLAFGNSIKLSCESARVLGSAPAVEMIPPKYVAPESSRFNVTAEADIWCLGAALFESLTQKVWTEDSGEEVYALPEPFATVVLRCLEDAPANRCKLPETVGLLKGQIKPAARVRVKTAPAIAPTDVVVPKTELQTATPDKTENVIPMVPKAEPSTPLKQELASSSGTGAAVQPAAAPSSVEARDNSTTLHAVPKPAPKPPAPERPLEARASSVQPPKSPVAPRVAPPSSPVATPAPRPLQPQKRTGDDDEPAAKIWIWAGIALLVVLALVWALRPKTQTKPVGPAKTSPVASNPAPAKPAGNAWETRTLQPDGTASKAAATATPDRSSSPSSARSASPKASPAVPAVNHTDARASTKPASGTIKGNVWRVILYTYNQRETAETKAQALNAKHSSLHAEVFAPSGDSGPFLITAGGPMSREEAVEARRRALGSGMPRDSYLQNYSK